MARKLLLVGVVAALLVVPGIGLSAVVLDLSLTDTSSGVPGTDYSLVVNSLGGNTYNAVLTADTVDINSADWYINWFQIKFDGGEAAFITTVNADPDGDWEIMQGGANINLAEFGQEKFATNTWSGLYEDSALEGAGLTDLDDGPQLDGGTYVWDFNFTLSNPFNQTPSLQVGYYDGFAGGSQNILQTRLSQKFGVPEPSTLIMVGIGLIGLAGFGRKKFKK